MRSSSPTTRIRFMSPILPDRQAEPEHGAGARLPVVQHDPAAVRLGDRRDDRQSETEPVVGAGRGEAIEDLPAQLGWHPGPVVGYPELDRAPGRAGPDRDAAAVGGVAD